MEALDKDKNIVTLSLLTISDRNQSKADERTIGSPVLTVASNRTECEPPDDDDRACRSNPHSTNIIYSTQDSSPKMLTQVIVSLVMAFTHLGIGAVNGFSGVTLPQLTQPESEDIYLDPNLAALFGSIVPLGLAMGSLTCGPFVSRVGHCRTLLLSLPLALIFWLLLAYASSVMFVIISRVALGFMAGVVYATSTSYTLEITHEEHRGVLFSVTPVMRQSGTLFVYFLALGSSPLTWRQMALVCGMVSTVPPFIGLFFFPESPRWLLTRSRENDALKSMIFFRGQKYNSYRELKGVLKEVDQGGKAVDVKQQLCQLFRPPVRKTFFILAFLCFIANFNGGSAIMSFLVPFFQVLSIDINEYTSAVLVGGVRVAGTILSVVLIERLGRRFLHLSTYFVMSLTVGAIGGYFFFQELEWVKDYLSFLPLTSLMIYTFFMGTGQPVIMMMIGELLPTSVRAIGVSILIFITFFGSFFVTQIYNLMAEGLGMHGILWTYSICSMFVFVISLYVLPETRGLSLEAITDKENHKNNQS